MQGDVKRGKKKDTGGTRDSPINKSGTISASKLIMTARDNSLKETEIH